MHALVCVGFVAFALAAGIADVRSRRIPNWLTVSGAAAGVGLAAARGGSPSFLLSIEGLAAGLGIGFALFLTRTLGAGDAKFIAAGSAWAGWERLPVAVVAMLGAGAAFALLWAARQRILKGTLLSTTAMVGAAISGGDRLAPAMGNTAAGKFPYGVGLGLGAIAWWLWAGCALP
jgi:Flp pilus assembly protein protease CpaA